MLNLRRSLAACALLIAAPSMAGTQLPLPCIAGSCGPNGPGSFLGSGKATAVAAGNTLTVQQATEQAVLNWASFNVSAGGKVVFKQPDTSAIALNQIFQASPSQIFGLVKANGQVYLINQNGLVFGPTAQVNVGGLLASSLSLTGPLSAGLLAPIQNDMPALASDGRTSVLDAAGNPVLGPNGQPLPVQVVVQPGAQISTAADGGRIFLAGQSVSNGGSISAPDGQVILAAGQSVYIQASSDPNLRGLIVEVDSGGLAENQLQGSISVQEGNVSLVGLAVNQLGRISATTSVSENGSIRLLARDTVNVQSVLGTLELFPSHGGDLTLGAQSRTSVLPDTASTATAIDQQAQPPSTITLAGQQVELTGGSQVMAPGGQVAMTASSNPSIPNAAATPDPGAHLRIDSGALIDVAGSTASVPVTDNLISVQLRGSELADSPLQRDGALRGQTVIIDARVGTPLADVSGDIALIQRNILQRTSTGGSLTVDSGGDVVVAQGATLNVSGGQVDYTPGIMQTSLLIEPNGATVNIGSASPNQTYVGVVNPTFKSVSNQWGVISYIPTPGIAYYDPGYTQGMSAGSIQILGSSLVLNGNFLGQAVNGIYQRSGSGVASGGTFAIGVSTPANPAVPDYRAPAVELVNEAPPVVVDPNASLPSDLPVQLSTDLITTGGFTHLQISSNDKISVPSGVSLDLGPGGSISLLAPLIDLDSSIKIPSGTIQLTSALSLNAPQGTPSLGIFIGDGVNFNVSGLWVNDTLVPLNLTPTGLALVNAGSVLLEQNVFQGTLGIGSGVGLIANGGAWLERGGTLSNGAGGSIALVGSPGGTVQVGDGDVVQGFGVQGALGGSFTLEVPRLQISSGDTTWLRAQSVDSDPNASAVFKIDSSLFSDFGFSSFKLTADGPAALTGPSQDVLTVMPGTEINLRTSTLVLDSSSGQQATGLSLASFATATLLPLNQRTPSQLDLQAAPGNITQSQIGNLTVAANASIIADPGSSITLASVGNLNFNGSIDSPSSKVSLDILTPAASFDPGFVPSQLIELGPSAEINVAGTVVYQPTNTGLLTGQVLAGGSVTLDAARGSVVTEAGSMIDFSGTQAPIDLPMAVAGSTATQRQVVASAAGSFSIDAPESISLLGTYLGEAGVGTTGRAPGGTLDLTLSSLSVPSGSGFPAGPFVITVQPGPLSTVLSPYSGSAVLSAAQLSDSGIDALTLVADNAVQFTNGVQLNLARSLTITAPAVEVASQAPVNVNAPYIALGTASTAEATQPALPGNATISFNGAEVDLIGALAFQGVGNAMLASSGEVLLRGELTDTNNLGSLSIAGDLTLNSARVVPTTTVDFTITASGGRDNTVRFEQNGSLSGVPLSVGGSLTVNADSIIQGGTVFAPFGKLTFDATDNLTFSPGSLTSVSGTSAILPYGQVQNGTAWVYQVSPNQLAPAAVTALPTRQVSATGAKVTLASGATIDVSGGGDLDGYEWTPGTGGTTDVLSPSVTPGLYAVLPSLLGQTAPYDPMLWAGSTIAPNQSIYLSAGGGLAAGIYPLLPARYALLPGAFLVSVASGYQDLPPGVQAQAGNGYPIVSGYFTYGSTGLGNTRTSGILVEPGTYAQTLAAYTNNYASTFFAAAAANLPAAPVPSSPLPADAGILVVSVQSGFDALGRVNGAPAPGGEGATVEINAPQIVVAPAVSATASVPGVIHLSSDVIDSWNAGRLWLGLAGESDSSFTVSASSVEVTGGSKLTADEIMLAATGSIQVDAGASVTTTSAANAGAAPAAASAMATTLPLSGSSAGAAILIASDLDYWLTDRSGAPAGPSGTLAVASGAAVDSRGALTFDAPGGGTFADGTLAGARAQWSFGTTNITFGPQGSAPGGFALDASLIGVLKNAGTVQLASAEAINLLQPVSLGGASGGAGINEIDIVAPGINSSAGSGAASFSAGLITLTGSAGTVAAPQPGSGSLSLTAREIDIDSGNLALSGFGTATLDASNVVVGMGSGSLATSGALKVLTPIFTTDSGAQTRITAGGNLTLAASSQPADGTAPALQTGGSLSLTGASITDSTLISMPSGELSLNATQQLAMSDGAGVEVAGVQPANAPHGSDGGIISLNSGGSLSAASGVLLSVAAGFGAAAGSISVAAGGAADFEAQLDGAALAGMRSGSFALRAGSIPNFSSLNNALEQSGFHAARSIEVGSGDLDLAAGSSITAQNVVLTADTGGVTVAGTIDASSESSGGSISLSAHNGLTLTSTANLAANGIGTGIPGGRSSSHRPQAPCKSHPPRKLPRTAKAIPARSSCARGNRQSAPTPTSPACPLI